MYISQVVNYYSILGVQQDTCWQVFTSILLANQGHMVSLIIVSLQKKYCTSDSYFAPHLLCLLMYPYTLGFIWSSSEQNWFHIYSFGFVILCLRSWNSWGKGQQHGSGPSYYTKMFTCTSPNTNKTSSYSCSQGDCIIAPFQFTTISQQINLPPRTISTALATTMCLHTQVFSQTHLWCFFPVWEGIVRCQANSNAGQPSYSKKTFQFKCVI